MTDCFAYVNNKNKKNYTAIFAPKNGANWPHFVFLFFNCGQRKARKFLPLRKCAMLTSFKTTRFRRFSMKRATTVALTLALLLSLSACGTDKNDRAIGGGAVGAVGGAVLGSMVGAPGTGALVGASVGAATGALTTSDQFNLGKPWWK